MSELFERRHLGRQEEAISESGVQLRTDDPATPVINQTWINKSQNMLKTFDGTNTLVLVEGSIGAALEVPPSAVLDAAKSRSYFKSVSADFQISGFLNMPDGMDIWLKIANENPDIQEVTEIAFGSPTLIPNSSYFLINSASNENKYYVWLDYDSTGVDPLVGGRTGVKVLTSAGLREISTITIPNQLTSPISSGDHFLVNSALNAVEYYVWFNKDGEGGSPLLPGKTGIQVAILSSDTEAMIAEKIKDAVDAVAGLSATFVDESVTISCEDVGVTDALMNASVPSLVVVRDQIGKNPDTPVQLATKVAAALDTLPDFSVPVPVSQTITITNTEPGFTENAINGNMGSEVSVQTTVEGSGKIQVILPLNCVLPDGLDSFVSGEKERVFRMMRIGSSVLVVDAGTFSL